MEGEEEREEDAIKDEEGEENGFYVVFARCLLHSHTKQGPKDSHKLKEIRSWVVFVLTSIVSVVRSLPLFSFLFGFIRDSNASKALHLAHALTFVAVRVRVDGFL